MSDPAHLPAAQRFTEKEFAETHDAGPNEEPLPLTHEQRTLLRDRLLRGQTPQAAAAEAGVEPDDLAAALADPAVRRDLEAVDRLRAENLLALAYQRALKGSERMLDLFLKLRPPARDADADDGAADNETLMGMDDAEFEAHLAARTGRPAAAAADDPRPADRPHPAGVPGRPGGAAGSADPHARRADAGGDDAAVPAGGLRGPGPGLGAARGPRADGCDGRDG